MIDFLYRHSLALVCVFAISGCATNREILGEAIYAERGVTVSDALRLKVNPESELPDPSEKDLAVDLSGHWVPASIDEFTVGWHFPPTCQDLTGACWSFSGTSFLESEIARKTGEPIRLSEMYFIYWETVEKAKAYIRSRGESRFSRGGQANATLRIAQDYGAVPLEAYGDIDRETAVYQDAEMFRRITDRLEYAKETDRWNEDAIMDDVRDIMDEMMGAPPEQVDVDDFSMTPRGFFTSVCQIDPDEYVDVISLMEFPFGEEVVYPVPDNWWHAPYLNVSLDDFIRIFRTATDEGYTICHAGDISGPGYLPRHDVAVIPSFDIPSSAVSDAARQLRFDEGTSSDDHAVHTVGSLEHNGEHWYLVKDSYPSAMDGDVPGYMFYSEDYIALKVLNITVHRDVVEKVLNY